MQANCLVVLLWESEVIFFIAIQMTFHAVIIIISLKMLACICVWQSKWKKEDSL